MQQNRDGLLPGSGPLDLSQRAFPPCGRACFSVALALGTFACGLHCGGHARVRRAADLSTLLWLSAFDQPIKRNSPMRCNGGEIVKRGPNPSTFVPANHVLWNAHFFSVIHLAHCPPQFAEPFCDSRPIHKPVTGGTHYAFHV